MPMLSPRNVGYVMGFWAIALAFGIGYYLVTGGGALVSEPTGDDIKWIARYLNLNPDAPDGWPVETLRRLFFIRQIRGEARFRRECDLMMSFRSSPSPASSSHDPDIRK